MLMILDILVCVRRYFVKYRLVKTTKE